MEPKTVGLIIGASISALAGLIGSIISHWLTSRRDQLQWKRQQEAQHHEWLRSKKEESYKKAIRYLLRAANKRSSLIVTGEFLLEHEYLKEWIDDLIESQTALASLAIHTSDQHKHQIQEAYLQLHHSIQDLLGTSQRQISKTSDTTSQLVDFGELATIKSKIEDVYKTVLQCANDDLLS